MASPFWLTLNTRATNALKLYAQHAPWQKIVTLLALGILCLLIAIPLQYWAERDQPLEQTAQKLANRLDILANDFDQWATTQHDLIKRLAAQDYDEAELNSLIDKEYTILVLQYDEILFWNQNDVIPSKDFLSLLPEGITNVRIANGYYQAIRRDLPFSEPDYAQMSVIGLQLIKNDYVETNRYLQNTLNPALHLSDSLTLSLTREGFDYVQVPQTNHNTPLFLYDDDSDVSTGTMLYIILILQCLGLLLVLLSFTHLAIAMLPYFYPAISIGIMWLLLLLIRAVMLRYGLPSYLSHFPLFSPNAAITTPIFLSVGQLLISLIFSTWALLFAYQAIPSSDWPPQEQEQEQERTSYLPAILLGLALVSALGMAGAVTYVLRLLIALFNVSFELSTIYAAPRNIIYFVVLGLLLASFFFALQTIARLIVSLQVQPSTYWKTTLAVAVLVWTLGRVFAWEVALYLPFIAWLWVFVYGIYSIDISAYSRFNIKKVFFWSCFIALFVTYYIELFRQDKEIHHKQELAEKLLTREDQVIETTFEESARQLSMNDGVIRTYYQNPMLPYEELYKRIKRLYFNSQVYSKYNISIWTFDDKGNAIKNNNSAYTLDDFSKLISRQQVSSRKNYLHLITGSEGEYNYLAKLPVFGKGSSLVGYMLIKMEPKSQKTTTSVYPELILQDQYNTDDEPKYSYAIYKKGLLESYQGNYPYNYKQDRAFQPIAPNDSSKTAAHPSQIRHNRYTHYIAQVGNEKTVIVSSLYSFGSAFFSQFSSVALLLMTGLMLVTPILAMPEQISQKRQKWQLKNLFPRSLRNQINVFIAALLLFSFLIIGGFTVNTFRERSTQGNREQLIQKQNEILKGLEKDIQQQKEVLPNDSSGIAYNKTIPLLSEVHSIDINLYDTLGMLITSSQPTIFERNLMSNYMNSKAYYEMSHATRNQYIQNETIGKLNYLAAYVPIKNDVGSIIAYLNIPYFAQEKELQNEISAFLAALINIYMILLLGSATLALIFADRITNPLQEIGEKMRQITLGQQNELIYWEHDDEIGALVREYNNAVQKLEESASQLARSERETAWQQMARQVAHEIKNPLTPMKLSIQYLQRAQKDDSPNLKQLTAKVANTLIEQIDTLSRVASDFSDFAKTFNPTPNREIIDLNEVANNIANLYENTENIFVMLDIPYDDSYIYADKAQIVRVLTNLIKNAIQAIPEEQEGRIIVSVKPKPERILLSVADNGIGISPEQAEKVFAPNFTTKSSGMGLGLAMTQQIIKNAQGQIWFESAVGEGTTFFIDLPRYYPENTVAEIEEETQEEENLNTTR